MAAAGTVRHLVRGDVLFDEGDPPDALYVVTRGRLAIAIANPIDRRESVVALMEPGDLFGEMGMLDDGPRSAMARALEPSSVLAVPYDAGADDVRRAAAACCGTSPACSPSACGRWTRRSPTRCSSTSPGAPPSGCSSSPTAPTSSSLPVTQEELAGMVGASRERVNKAIASFIRLGWLEQHDRRYRSPSATASSSAPASAD